MSTVRARESEASSAHTIYILERESSREREEPGLGSGDMSVGYTLDCIARSRHSLNRIKQTAINLECFTLEMRTYIFLRNHTTTTPPPRLVYWYSQGCFIGCPSCDHKSGRRQTDLCKLGFVGKLPDFAIAVNRNISAGFRDSKYDIYR